MSKLKGKIALITGGASGIGLASARLFVAEGAAVIITDLRQQQLDAAVASIGRNVEGIQSDISSLADNQRLHDQVKSRFGRLDVLFANAGVGAVMPFGQVSEQQFDRIADVNFKGTFFAVQTLLQLIAEGGSIILTASIASSTGYPAFSVYSATRGPLDFGVESRSDAVAVGVRLVCCRPFR